jgi:hypothetical protein
MSDWLWLAAAGAIIAIDDYYAQANYDSLDGGLGFISQLCFLFVLVEVSDELVNQVGSLLHTDVSF